jgi:hypothetical protein
MYANPSQGVSGPRGGLRQAPRTAPTLFSGPLEPRCNGSDTVTEIHQEKGKALRQDQREGWRYAPRYSGASTSRPAVRTPQNLRGTKRGRSAKAPHPLPSEAAKLQGNMCGGAKRFKSARAFRNVSAIYMATKIYTMKTYEHLKENLRPLASRRSITLLRKGLSACHRHCIVTAVHMAHQCVLGTAPRGPLMGTSFSVQIDCCGRNNKDIELRFRDRLKEREEVLKA